MSVFKKAKKRLGITTDPREAGFILPTGELLDFSGKKLVAPRHRAVHLGTRLLDHTEVNKQIFREKGAIRVHVSSDLSDMLLSLGVQRRPTKKQWQAIQRIMLIGKRERPDFALGVDIYGKYTALGVAPLLHHEYIEDVKMRDVAKVRWLLTAFQKMPELRRT